MKGILLIACLGLAACSQQPGATADNPLGLKLDERAAIGACMTPAEETTPGAQIPPERRRQIISCIQAQAAQQIRPQLPQQVDPMTRLTDISAEGPMLTYHQSVDLDAETVTPDMLEQIEERVRAYVCGQRQMRETIDLGGGYAYRWSDKNGRPLHEIRIDRCGAGATGPVKL